MSSADRETLDAWLRNAVAGNYYASILGSTEHGIDEQDIASVVEPITGELISMATAAVLRSGVPDSLENCIELAWAKLVLHWGKSAAVPAADAAAFTAGVMAATIMRGSGAQVARARKVLRLERALSLSQVFQLSDLQPDGRLMVQSLLLHWGPADLREAMRDAIAGADPADAGLVAQGLIGETIHPRDTAAWFVNDVFLLAVLSRPELPKRRLESFVFHSCVQGLAPQVMVAMKAGGRPLADEWQILAGALKPGAFAVAAASLSSAERAVLRRELLEVGQGRLLEELTALDARDGTTRLSSRMRRLG